MWPVRSEIVISMRLHEWQLALQDAALGKNDRVNRALKGDSVPASARLGIYRNAYSSRLRDALRSNFPALHQLLGDDEFSTLAARYLTNHPSSHSSIRWFGEQLPEFLEVTVPYRSTPVMVELARFEWALRHTIDAADLDRIEFPEMATLAPGAWGALRFSLHPSLTILDLRWNVLPIWQALTNLTAPPSPCLADRPGHGEIVVAGADAAVLLRPAHAVLDLRSSAVRRRIQRKPPFIRI